MSKPDAPAFPLSSHFDCRGEIEWTDPRASGMTLREYAAIHLKVPNSGKTWLDDMIRDARRKDIAGQALAALSRPTNHSSDPRTWDWKMLAEASYIAADAMPSERKEETKES